MSQSTLPQDNSNPQQSHMRLPCLNHLSLWRTTCEHEMCCEANGNKEFAPPQWQILHQTDQRYRQNSHEHHIDMSSLRGFRRLHQGHFRSSIGFRRLHQGHFRSSIGFMRLHEGHYREGTLSIQKGQVTMQMTIQVAMRP